MIRLSKMLSLLLLVALQGVAVPPLAADQPRLTADSLQSLLEQGLAAFSAHDLSLAADLFQRIEKEFAEEPQLRDPTFLRRILPLQGHAELSAGQPSAAARTLTRFVDAFPDDPQHASALFALGSALRKDEQLESAATRFQQYGETYPHRPEAGLALLQRADILLILSKETEAVQLLEGFSTGKAPATMRNQARLRAAKAILGTDDTKGAARLLLDYAWDVPTMPEISVLAFTALELGDQLLEAGEADMAVRAYRLVLPRDRLLNLQRERVRDIERQLQRTGSTAGNFWREYYRNLLSGLTRQLATLEEGDDYTPFLLLRRGQALLLADRHREAWLLFEQLALDASLPASTRQEAHYRWIIAASHLELWEESLTIARNFVARYPTAELAPQALYLIAQAHQGQRRYADASEVLSDLLARFSSHPLAQRWRFTRGFNRTLLEEFAVARDDFAQSAADYPEGPMTPNAQLWHALTYFFERNYPSALAELDILAERYRQHPLSGEILYRRGATLYAMREYDRAARETAAFVEEFRAHQRYPEALVLLGDILMGAGKLDDADEIFAALAPDAEHLYLYGLFQRCKIFRAQEDYSKMISLFSEYAERKDLTEKPRLSEALYWIGWAHNQRGEPAEAVPVMLTALDRHGDDPASGEISSILGLLERMQDHLPSRPSNFSDWLQEQRRTALEDSRLTLFSRLNLQLAGLKRREKQPRQAEALLFEIANEVPMERLGPDALGEVGRLLAERELASGADFLLRLLKEYPGAPERALAYHGLAALESARGEHQEALTWLRRFLQETPTHPLSGDVMLLAGSCLMHMGQTEKATAQFEEILRLRTLRGRPHAEALRGLARTMEEAKEAEKAIAYYQRIYTVHRAQPDLVSEAYWNSALLFHDLGRTDATRRTLEEMLSLSDLRQFPEFELARQRLESLPPVASAAAP